MIFLFRSFYYYYILKSKTVNCINLLLLTQKSVCEFKFHFYLGAQRFMYEFHTKMHFMCLIDFSACITYYMY